MNTQDQELNQQLIQNPNEATVERLCCTKI